MDEARQTGLDGIISNSGPVEDPCVELVNLYSLPRFCRDMGATPERALDEVAALLADPWGHLDL